MTQKFVRVGRKAYRDAMDAIQDESFVAGKCPVDEFETSTRINEYYLVTTFKKDGDTVTPVGSFKALKIEEIEVQSPEGGLFQLVKVSVFPFLERKERKDKGSSQKAA